MQNDINVSFVFSQLVGVVRKIRLVDGRGHVACLWNENRHVSDFEHFLSLLVQKFMRREMPRNRVVGTSKQEPLAEDRKGAVYGGKG